MIAVKEVFKAHSVREALELRRDHPESEYIAGGTDVLVKVRAGKYQGDLTLIDLSSLRDELAYIRKEEGNIVIGALTTHSEAAASELLKQYVPGLCAGCAVVGSTQIRNHATLGGNIGNASPAADSVPSLIALDAAITLMRMDSDGEIVEYDLLLEEFFNRRRGRMYIPGELIAKITIPDIAGIEACTYRKVGARSALAIAIASCALVKKTGRFQVAFGSMSYMVSRLTELEEVLNGAELTEKKVRECIEQSMFPIDDVRASAKYRTEVCGGMLVSLLEECGVTLA